MKKTRSKVLAALVAVFAVALALSFVFSRNSEPPTKSSPVRQKHPTVARVSLLRRAAPAIPAQASGNEADKEQAPFDRQQYDAGDPFFMTLRNSLKFSARVRAALAAPQSGWATEGRRLLSSKSPEDRALGGILLMYAEKLDEETIHTIVNDRELFVPLTVFDWVRDFGTDEEIEVFANGVGTREISDDALVGLLAGSAKLPGGGRSALELYLARHDEETVFEGVMKFLSSPDVAYDVFEQAVLKLLEPENREDALSFIEKLEKNDKLDGNGLMIQMLWKLKRATEPELDEDDDEAVPYKVWDMSLKPLETVSNSDMGLVVRDVANYLEYGLRRDDPDFEPVIEEGSWERASKFLEWVKGSEASLTDEELDALGRLEAYVERIREYDPAFAPDDEEDDDEEIDEETLNAQDMEEAEFLESDDESDDEDEDDEDDEDGDEDEDEDDEDEDDEDDEDDDEDEDEDDEEEDDADADDESDTDEDDEDEEDEEDEDDDDEDDADEDDDDENEVATDNADDGK